MDRVVTSLFLKGQPNYKPAPFWHLICINLCSDKDLALFWFYLGQICIKCGANLYSEFKYTELHFSNFIS